MFKCFIFSFWLSQWFSVSWDCGSVSGSKDMVLLGPCGARDSLSYPSNVQGLQSHSQLFGGELLGLYLTIFGDFQSFTQKCLEAHVVPGIELGSGT